MNCPECGYANDESASFCCACGSLLKKNIGGGRYTIEKILGKGGMGQVMLAHDNKMDTHIVLKQLISPKDRADKAENLRMEYLESRMREEAKLLYRLNYAGLPKVMDFLHEDGSSFLIMQYINGKNLAQILAEEPDGKIELSKCVRWMDRLLDILRFLHDQSPSIIHRDIKPQNIMLDSSGILYLVDFGLAITLEMKRDYTRVGTYDYASPENYSGTFDITSDIYSLGATFYHLITGLAPRDRAHPGSFPPIRTFVPDCPEKLQEIFDKMLSFAKENRYKNCLEIRRELRRDPVLEGFLTESIVLQTRQAVTPEIKVKADVSESITEKDLPEEKLPQSGAVSGSDNGSDSADSSAYNENNEKKHSGLTKIIYSKPVFAGITVTIILLAVVFFFIREGLPAFPFTRKGKNVRYRLTVITPEIDNIVIMEKTLNERNLKYFRIRRRDSEQKKTRLSVLSYFDSRSAAATAYMNLKNKGLKVALDENPDQGIFIHYAGIIKDPETGGKLAKEFNIEAKDNLFSVQEIPVKYPVIKFELIIPGITSKKLANELQKDFSEYSDQIEIKEIKVKESNDDEAVKK